jgi:GNAT superfamily N-acetyltransferase
MAGLTVAPERGKADRRAFVDLPYRLYRDDPIWVPPLRMAEAALMDRRKNPFFEHAEVEHFLARRDGRVVGRIAAIENRRHNEVHEDRTGFFGFFDVEADPGATVALLEAARTWVGARGLDPMRGPVNYSTNDSCGVLVEGFDESPRILMPYNRPDYDELLRAAGLVGVKDLLALWISTENPVPPRFQRVVDRVLERRGITVRPIARDRFDEELPILLDLYNRSWEKNWGFVPATEAEFRHAASDLKALLHPALSGVAEKNGVPVGFAVFIRDLNVLLRGTRGRLFPFHWLRLLLGIKKIGPARCVLLGIVPEARGSAINEAFFARALTQGAQVGCPGAEAGWVLADNHAMLAPIEAAGGELRKRYRMYETPATGCNR